MQPSSSYLQLQKSEQNTPEMGKITDGNSQLQLQRCT